MRRWVPVWLFGGAVASAVGVIFVVGRGEGSPLIVAVAVAGGLVSAAGGAAGVPALMYAGAVVLLGGFGLTLATGSSGALDSLVVAILLWLHVELSLRSMELRRAVVPQATVVVSWLAVTSVVIAGVVVLWMLVGAVVGIAPVGGLFFRVLAVVVVVVIAVMVSGLPYGRGERNRRRLPG